MNQEDEDFEETVTAFLKMKMKNFVKMKNFALTFVKMKKRNEVDEDEDEDEAFFQWVLRTIPK